VQLQLPEVLVKRSAQVLGWCVFSMLLFGCALAANAQERLTPNVEITGGVQALHIPDKTYPFGWNVDMSGPAGDHELVRWVGEVGMADDRPAIGFEPYRFYHFGAGVRLTPASRTHAVPFLQLVGGVAYARRPVVINPGDAQWAPMFQPGAGVSVPLNRYIAIVGQGDYRLAVFSGQLDNEFRVSLGARLMLW
jgi:hypothetical protein